MILVPLISAVVGVAQRWWSSRVGEGIIFDLRRELFAHLQRMSLRFFTATKTGELMNRLNSDVEGSQSAITGTLMTIISNLVSVAFILVVMLAERLATDGPGGGRSPSVCDPGPSRSQGPEADDPTADGAGGQDVGHPPGELQRQWCPPGSTLRALGRDGPALWGASGQGPGPRGETGHGGAGLLRGLGAGGSHRHRHGVLGWRLSSHPGRHVHRGPV